MVVLPSEKKGYKKARHAESGNEPTSVTSLAMEVRVLRRPEE